jgi:hypothetical protein
MAEESEAVAWNYFNYFTEVEEHFQRARSTGLFLMSPLDWALVESWKNSGVPLEAVLRGIDHAFEKWHAKKSKQRMVNSVAYCAQAVAEEAQAMAEGAPAVRRQSVSAPFELEELRAFLSNNAAAIRGRGGFEEIAASLEDLAAGAENHYTDLEELEQRLTALEDKMSALVRASLSEEELFSMRRELDATMRPYRGRMTADQIAMLERQYLDRRIQEKAGLPRLSLFYLK